MEPGEAAPIDEPGDRLDVPTSQQTVTVTIEFCNWLAAEHNTTVEQVTQGHIAR